MLRKAREESATGIYHVMIRGIKYSGGHLSQVVMGAPGYGCLFSWQFFSNIPDGLVVHARNSGELSWPDIERTYNLLNNTFSSF